MIKNKTLLFKVLILSMFFFNNANANYDKKFYDHQIQTIDGNNQNLNIYKNKVVLLVNTASYCGFTKQYEDLQKIWDKYKNKNFVVLGVPSNSFNQEKTNEKDIKEF